jgi:hypothetical protein
MEKKTPEQMIAELHQRALDDIEIQRTRLNERYEFIPSRLKKLAEMTGMDEATIITAAARATHSHANLTWDEVLSVVHTFYLHKRNLEREGQED